MRTLNKTLSLVLALVLCLGLVGSAFAANYDEYTDAEQVGEKYAEAVDVMMGTGIISGMTDTEIAPEGTLTREQAAKIITYMKLGEKLAETLKADKAPFEDVEADRWSAGYIGYCVKQGIVSGVGDNLFDPTGELTGFAFAKMILVALGYDAAEYEGDGWAIAVATDAFKAGIFSGDDAAATNDALQRQQAMLVAFNGLGYTATGATVKYVVKDGSTTIYEGTNETVAYIAFTGATSGTIEEVEDKADSLGAVNYGLTETTKTDAFGRKTKAFTNGKTGAAEVVYASSTVDAVVTYTAATTAKTIAADLKGYSIMDDTTPTAVKKAMTAGSYTSADVLSTDGAAATGLNVTASGATTASAIAALTGNGVEVVIYANAAKVITGILVVNTYIDTVASVAPATATTKETVTLANGKYSVKTFEIAGLKTADVVLFTAANGTTPKIVSVEKIEPTELTATGLNGTGATSTFVAGGTTYEYAANSTTNYIAATDVTGKVAKNVWFDKYGYVLDTANVSAAPVPTNYAIALKATEATTLDGVTVTARMLLTDGTTKDVVIAKVGGTAPTTASDVGENTIYSYVEKDGKFELTTKNALKTTAATDIDKNTVTMSLAGSSVKANAKTIFVIETVPAAGKPVYTVYTGIANVPSLTNAADKGAAWDAVDGYAAIVFVKEATLDTAPATDIKDIVYVAKASGDSAVDVAKGKYFTYNAVVNGVITTVEMDEAITGDALYKSIQNTDKGVIDTSECADMTTAAPITVDKDVTGTGKAVDGVVKLGSAEMIYNEDTLVFMINAGVIAASSVAAIKDDANDMVTYYTTNGVLTAAFITVVA